MPCPTHRASCQSCRSQRRDYSASSTCSGGSAARRGDRLLAGSYCSPHGHDGRCGCARSGSSHRNEAGLDQMAIASGVRCRPGCYRCVLRCCSGNDAQRVRRQGVEARPCLSSSRLGIPLWGHVVVAVLPAMLARDAGTLATEVASRLVLRMRTPSLSSDRRMSGVRQVSTATTGLSTRAHTDGMCVRLRHQPDPRPRSRRRASDR